MAAEDGAIVVTEPAPGVVLATMTRPAKKNALTAAMYGALVDALAEADRARAGALVIAGAGGAFTAGNDLADFLEFAGLPIEEVPPFRFIRQLARTRTPLVAAVSGVAVGVGTTLILHCDLAYAAPDARFRMPFADLGLVPEAGSSWLLPRRVGLAKASEFLMLGEGFDAAEALRLNLVNAVLPADALLEHAVAAAARLAGKPRAALSATRALLRGDPAELDAAITRESAAFEAALRSPEARAAFESFLARSGARTAKPAA